MTWTDETKHLPTVRVALLDDHELLLDSLSTWINTNEPQFDLVLAVGTWVELVRSPAFPTDLVLMDLQLKERVSIEARVRTCRAAGTTVIVLSALDTEEDKARALAAGASAYLTKAQPVREVMAIARSVMGVDAELDTDPDGLGAGQSGSGQRGSGQNSAGRHSRDQIGSRRNGAGRSGVGQNGAGQNGAGRHSRDQNGSGQNGSGQNGYELNGGGHGTALTRPKLSDGELIALGLYVAGQTTVQVARNMNVGYETAKTYLRRIREKYTRAGRPTSTRADLIRRAAEDGYLT